MRRIGHISLCMVLILAMLTCTAAMADVDLNKNGSVSVRIHTQEDVNVRNAHIELYRVGAPVIANHNLHFTPTGAFESCNVSLNDLSDTGMAASLASWAKENNISPSMQADTTKEGTAAFKAVSTGLYLVVQNGFADGKKGSYSEIQPFIVTIPMTGDAGTEWIYEINAQPKVNPVATPAPTVKPTDPPSDNTLPQTGMLRWPIPVLGVGGIVLFSIGWVLFFGKKKEDRNA